MTEKYFNNPENLSKEEIQRKIHVVGFGMAPLGNRNKRYDLLSTYNTNEITKEEYIKQYTTK